jgi:hypothetical protein
MQTQHTITLFGTVSNSATSRISKNGREYTAFGVAIISDRNLEAFHYNVVAFGNGPPSTKRTSSISSPFPSRLLSATSSSSSCQLFMAWRWRGAGAAPGELAVLGKTD